MTNFRKIFVLMVGLLMAVATRADERLVGGDLSMVAAYEEAGDQWLDADGKVIDDIVAYVKEKGWNTVRVRLFVDPTQDSDPSTCQDLAYVKALGKRVKTAGMKLLLDLHYSDTWADPGTQQIPVAWKGKTDEQLTEQIGTYTTEVLQEMVEAGATPDLVQTGNEITYGLLWQTVDGKMPASKDEYASAGYCTTWSANYSDGKAQWERTAKLLGAASQAVRKAVPSARIVLHTELGNVSATSDKFYKHLQTAGYTDYDVIGLSYYPFWHGTLSSLTSLINTMKSDFPDKKVEIVETAWVNNSYPKDANYSIEALGGRWKASAAGMVTYLQDLTSRLKNLSNVDGVFYWAPEECGKGYTKTVWPYSFNRGMWKVSSQQQHSLLKNDEGVTAVEALAGYLTPGGEAPNLSEAFTNLGFETGDLTGWTKDQEWTTMWPNNIASWASADVVRDSYTLELWNGSCSEGSVISQCGVVGKGRFLVTVRCKAEQSGFYLYANDRKTAITANAAGMYSVEANAADGMLTIGISTAESATAKYLYADDFTVTYVGEEVEDNPGEEEPDEPSLPDEYTDEQGVVYKLYDDHTAAVISGTGAFGEVSIPDVLVLNETDYYVTSVLENAFYGNSNLRAVTIGANITGIWNSAFNNCGQLEKVYFAENNNLTTIDKWVFSGTPLDSISIPAGVTVIKEGAFSNCWALKYVAMLGEVTEIQQFAFSKWTADDVATADRNWCPLDSGVWMYGVTVPSISPKAFNAEDIAAATLHVRAQHVGNAAYTQLGFAAVVAIEGTDELYIDKDGVRYLVDTEKGSATVVGATPGSGATVISIPATLSYQAAEESEAQEYAVNAIKPWAFYNNATLKEVTVGAGISCISEGAFSGCTALTNVELLNEEQMEIQDFAFSGWGEDEATSGCPQLTAVVLHTYADPISEKAFCKADISERTTLYVPQEDVTSYDDFGFKAVLPLGAYTAIATVKTGTQTGTIYNLSGQRLQSVPSKGVYVRGGVKVASRSEK